MSNSDENTRGRRRHWWKLGRVIQVQATIVFYYELNSIRILETINFWIFMDILTQKGGLEGHDCEGIIVI